MSTLIEKLGNRHKEWSLNTNYWMDDNLILDVFNDVINIVKQHSDWISVDERLPELGERVLTFTASGIETLYRSQYDSDLFIWERDCCQDYWTDEEVTHWQPLPQPPSEVQNV
jgi:hypothetical protein